MQTSTNSQANDKHLQDQLKEIKDFIKKLDETEKEWKEEVKKEETWKEDAKKSEPFDDSKKGNLYSQGLDILITCNQLVNEISELACKSSNQNIIKEAANVLKVYFKDRIKENGDLSDEIRDELACSVDNIEKSAKSKTDLKTAIKEHMDGINQELALLDLRCKEHTNQVNEMVALSDSLCSEYKEYSDTKADISKTLHSLHEQTLKIKEKTLEEVVGHLSSIRDILFDHWKKIDNLQELAKQLADTFDKSIRSHIVSQLEFGQSKALTRWSGCIYVIAALIQSFAGNNKVMFSYLDECVKNKFDLICSDIDAISSKFIGKAIEALGKNFSTIGNSFIYPSALAKLSAYMLTKEGCRATLEDIAKKLVTNKECSAVYREELFGMQAILLHHQGDTKKAAEILKKECSVALHNREEIAEILQKADELSKSETSTPVANSGASATTSAAASNNAGGAAADAKKPETAAGSEPSATTSAAASNNTGATVSDPKKREEEQTKQWELRLASSMNLGHFFVTKDKPNPRPADSNNSLGNISP